MRKIFTIIFLILSIPNLFAKGSSLEGRVVNTDGDGLPAVSIKIPELKKAVNSNTKGYFKFEDVKPGEYLLSFKRVGIRPFDTLLALKEGKNEVLIKISDVYEIKENVVVTGTRTAKQIESNPITTQVVGTDDIKKSGGLRLDNILNEETGLFTVDDHGKGIQIQGLDPDYALILINGEPLIGRNGGILDLKRMAMGNVKRIEIVKGPSSSMYGSNALSGVINIITDEPDKPFRLSTSARYESYNTLNLNADVGCMFKDTDIGFNIMADRVSSDGYTVYNDKMDKMESYGKTVPEYVNHTLMAELFYYITSNTQSKLTYRLNTEEQKNIFEIKQKDVKYIIDDLSTLNDNNLSFSLKHQLTDKLNVEGKAYYSAYNTVTNYTYQFNDSLYEKYTYDQTLAKYELIANHMLYFSHILTFGSGVNYESVKSGRISDKKITTDLYYAFYQHDWIASHNFNLIGSIRYDWHSDYAAHWSPKFAFSWKIFDGFNLKSAIGSGFKAPSFQQLYLDWTNSIAAYSVFGAAFFKDRFASLAKAGMIGDTLIPIDNIGVLKPEQSVSFNFGFVYDINDNYQVKLNLFRNNLTDMIETQAVANKTAQFGGAQVFTYFNLNEVFTQGVEFNFDFNLFDGFKFAGGYQYLEAYDVKVLDKIRDKKLYMNTDNGDRIVKESDYGGLFNRSKHSTNLKLQYTNIEYGFNVYLRGIIRGRYGWADRNNSTILDADNEYAPGYALWNITASKDIYDMFNIQAGVDNILDKFDPHHLTSNPGRTFFVKMTYNFSSK